MYSKLKLTILCMAMFIAAAVFPQAKAGITGSIEWETLEIKARVSLDLASAGIKLPAGRTQGETLIAAEYSRLIQPAILNLLVDSSSTIADLINRGDLNLFDVEAMAFRNSSLPPALSPDLRSISAAYTINLDNISSGLLRHVRPSEVMRTLNPVSAPAYTGIIIIASESLPIHGLAGSALPVPCLFPKLWDTNMNLIYERNMLDLKKTVMVRYFPVRSIFLESPSGLSPELTALVGEKPLRIFARGVFGINPTDLIIDREDALLIISSAENRRLLSDGKVAIILDDAMLRNEFTGN